MSPKVRFRRGLLKCPWSQNCHSKFFKKSADWHCGQTYSFLNYSLRKLKITNDDWAWFVGENREPIRLTTKPEPYTLQKALHWLQRQVAPTIKMVQALDRENHTTILKDMIEQAELKDKHKHLLQLEKSTIEERIDTAVPQENDGIF